MLKFIPIRASAGLGGFESPAAEYTELGLSLDELLIEHASATYLGFVEGESMTGVGIFPGDLLVVDRSLTAKTGDIVVATWNGQFVCKVADPQHRALRSARKGFRDIYIGEHDDFRIEGVVARSIRLHRPLSQLPVAAES